MLTVQEFRESFPQFTEELFPSLRVEFYLKLAAKQLSQERWNDLWVEGCCLHAAHNLTLEQEALKTRDGTGGLVVAAGPLISSSHAVGGVSKSESRAGIVAADPTAGQWNLTFYGQKYWQLAQMIGAGGLQI